MKNIVNIFKQFRHALRFLRSEQRDIEINFNRALGVLVFFAAVGALSLLINFYRVDSGARWSLVRAPQNSPSGAIPPIRGEAFIQIDFAVKPSRAFKGGIIDGMKVSDALEQASIAGNFSLQWAPVLAIDELADGTAGKHWAFYRNQEKINGPPQNVGVAADDEIFAKFE